MPHLIIRGVSVNQIKSISVSLVRELARICDCGTDNFTLEIPNSTYVLEGNEATCYPLIEVRWFERGKEIRDMFAQQVNDHIMSLGFQEVELVFSSYSEAVYYINGKSFVS
jgi:hypothetical protein